MRCCNVFVIVIVKWLPAIYCKTHYYCAPFNFTHFALGDDNAYITGADIRSKQQHNSPSSSDTVDARN